MLLTPWVSKEKDFWVSEENKISSRVPALGSSTWFPGSDGIGGHSYHRRNIPAIQQHPDRTCRGHGDECSLIGHVSSSRSLISVTKPRDLALIITAEMDFSALTSLDVEAKVVEEVAATFVSFSFEVVNASEVTASPVQ